MTNMYQKIDSKLRLYIEEGRLDEWTVSNFNSPDCWRTFVYLLDLEDCEFIINTSKSCAWNKLLLKEVIKRIDSSVETILLN